MFDKPKSSAILTLPKRKQGAHNDRLSHKKPASECDIQIYPSHCRATLQWPGISKRGNRARLKQKDSSRNLQTPQRHTMELLRGGGASPQAFPLNERNLT